MSGFIQAGTAMEATWNDLEKLEWCRALTFSGKDGIGLRNKTPDGYYGFAAIKESDLPELMKALVEVFGISRVLELTRPILCDLKGEEHSGKGEDK